MSGDDDSIIGTTLRGRRRAIVFLILLLFCSVTLNILLARKVNDLRQIETILRNAGDLQLDDVVPTLEAKTLDGKVVSFGYGDSESPMVIYVFSPDCGWCRKNSRNIDVLAKSVAQKYRFVALSLESDGLKQYSEEGHLSFPVYSDLLETTRSYKLGGTPETLVVSQQGRVLKNWRGAYIDSLKGEIEAYFGIQLPGVDQ